MTAAQVLLMFIFYFPSSEEMKIETFLQLILLLPTAFQFHIKVSVNTVLLLDQTTQQNGNKNNLLWKKSSGFFH